MEALKDLREVTFQVLQERKRRCPFWILGRLEEIKKRGIKICPFAGPGCTLKASFSCQFFLENKEKIWEMLEKEFPFPKSFCPCVLSEGILGGCDLRNRNEIARKFNLNSCWLRVHWEDEELVICLLRELSRLHGIEIEI